MEFTPAMLSDLAGGDCAVIPNFLDVDLASSMGESLSLEIEGTSAMQSDVDRDGSRPVHRCPQHPQPWNNRRHPHLSGWSPSIYAVKNLVEEEAGHGFNWASIRLRNDERVEDGAELDSQTLGYESEIMLDQRPGSYIAILFICNGQEVQDPSVYGPSPTSVAYSVTGLMSDISTEETDAQDKDQSDTSCQFLTFAPKQFADAEFRQKGPQTVSVRHNTLVLIGPKTAQSFVHKIDNTRSFGRIVLRSATTMCIPLSRENAALRLGLYGPSVQNCGTKKAMHRLNRWQEFTQLMVWPSTAALATLGTVAIASLSTKLSVFAGEALSLLRHDSTTVAVGTVAAMRTMLATLIAGFTTTAQCTSLLTSTTAGVPGQEAGQEGTLQEHGQGLSLAAAAAAGQESEHQQRFSLLFDLFKLHPLDGPAALTLLEHGTVAELSQLSAEGEEGTEENSQLSQTERATTATEHLATVLQRCADRARDGVIWAFASRVTPSSANTAHW
jgi:hypothetical protein